LIQKIKGVDGTVLWFPWHVGSSSAAIRYG
jgi:hypothetical protein